MRQSKDGVKGHHFEVRLIVQATTDVMMNLCAPVEKSADADLLGEIIGFRSGVTTRFLAHALPPYREPLTAMTPFFDMAIAGCLLRPAGHSA